MKTSSPLQHYLEVLGVERLFFDQPSFAVSDPELQPLLEAGPTPGVGSEERRAPEALRKSSEATPHFAIFFSLDSSSVDSNTPEADLLNKMLASLDRPAHCATVDLRHSDLPNADLPMSDLKDSAEFQPALKLNLILGRKAYEIITGGKGPTFEQAYGVIQTFREKRWLTTSGPAELLKDSNLKRLAWSHLKLFIQEMKTN